MHKKILFISNFKKSGNTAKTVRLVNSSEDEQEVLFANLSQNEDHFLQGKVADFTPPKI